MAAITDVTLTAGVPTAGTGTVTTLDKFDSAAGVSATRALTVQGIGSGTAMPVSGTVTANAGTGTLAVSLASVPSHPVTNAGTFAVQVSSAPSTAVTNAGTFLVQNNAATPAGTNNIGDIDVLTISGVTPAFGSGANGATVLRTALATDSPGVIAVGTAGTAASNVVTVQGIAAMTPVTVSNTPLTNFGAGEYETVAASQTAQVLGATGATGDYLQGLLVIPATTSPGNVLLLDNATSITVFVGGATSVSNLVPFFIPCGMISVSGAWKVTTGANVSVIGIGNFT